MSTVAGLWEPLKRFDLARIVELRAAAPPVAVELDRSEAILVRVKPRRRGKPLLEERRVRPMPDNTVGASIFRPNLGAPEEMVGRLKEMFEATGTKPGRLSVVLPDNLAKISIVTLPERPQNRKQVQEVLRFKLRRSVPFRLEDAAISWQEISGDGREASFLVAVMLRSVVEQYESVFEAAGARPGLVSLCTPSLYNLCRTDLAAAVAGGADAALLNCAESYFSLLIVRGGRLVFFRCKSFVVGDEGPGTHNGVMARELASSFSYYQEKLSGEGIGTTLVRTTSTQFDRIAETLGRLGVDDVRPVDPASAVELPDGGALGPEEAHRIAPCVGATMRRGA